MTPFLLLLGAHFCGDFLLYFPALSSGKRKAAPGSRIRAAVIHCSLHFILVVVWLFPFDMITRVISATIVSTTHCFIDGLRVHIEPFFFPKKDFTILKRKEVFGFFMGRRHSPSAPFLSKHLLFWILINLADQGMHMLVIIAVAVVLS